MIEFSIENKKKNELPKQVDAYMTSRRVTVIKNKKKGKPFDWLCGGYCRLCNMTV